MNIMLGSIGCIALNRITSRMMERDRTHDPETAKCLLPDMQWRVQVVLNAFGNGNKSHILFISN